MTPAGRGQPRHRLPSGAQVHDGGRLSDAAFRALLYSQDVNDNASRDALFVFAFSCVRRTPAGRFAMS